MKANKVTVKLTIEVLSIDAISGLAWKALKQIEEEFENGELIANDGDAIYWETKRTEVTF